MVFRAKHKTCVFPSLSLLLAGSGEKSGLETVVAQRPRCNGAGLRKYRSQHDQGDGTSLSWVPCLDAECGRRFRLVLE